ncbi:PAS domain-containing protein [Opitutus sp. ER46]|uniref:hybrid sensor histidine kinase/response regulator n=1 Tax=Opitutus sp. ER46 TaxID=2161864 RepID=UPI0013050314|nr:PAS domain-containing protein [Opitutus sp. ER46]
MKISDAVSPALAPTALPPLKLGALGPRRGARGALVRVLVLDDNEDDFAFVKVLLGKSVTFQYELEWAPTEEAALEAIRERRPDVGLFDYRLAGTTGLDLLRKLQADSCEMPIILLTGSENPEVDQAALDAGAADYLCKSSLDTTRLERAIRYSRSHAAMLSALRQSQAQLQLFMRSVPCAVCIYDETTSALLFQNEIFSRHFTVEAIVRFQQHGGAAEVPTHFYHANRHWLISSFPMVEQNGRALQGLAAIDITTRINAEEALRKTSEFLNGMLATLPVAVARVDENGTIREARGQALAALGLRDNELNGASIFSLFPQAETSIQQALGGGSANFTSEVTQGDKTCHFENYYRFDRSRGAGAMGFTIDVTARVEAEKAIKQKSQLLNGLVANLPMVVGRLDPDGVVVEAQGQKLEQYGMNPEAIIGRRLADLYPQLQPSVAEALAGGAVNSVLTSRYEDTEWFADVFLFFDHELDRGALFFGCDITQRKMIERELLRVSDVEKNRIGSDLHDGLGQYLTGISCLSAALRDKLSANQRSEAEEAATISSLVQEAIAQTRALARGLCPVQLETAGLDTALEDLTYQVQRMHNTDCRFVSAGTMPPCDSTVALHLYRIAQEAINNAVKHSGAQHITVTLDFSQENKVLRIEDDGCGFDPEVKHRPSSGLHLMPYRAAMIGGTLNITSQPSAGTTVECRFVYPS